MFGRVPVQNNRMFLSDSTSPGTLVTPGINATNGSLIFSYFPFLGGIGNYKINTILPYKNTTVTAETKFRIMFYTCTETTLFDELAPIYGGYTANNYFEAGFASAGAQSFTNNDGTTSTYSGLNASTSTYVPLPKTLVGYSAVITIAAGSGNQTIGHTQMYDAAGNEGFYLPDGMYIMVTEIESTNSAVGTFGRISKVPTITSQNLFNCSPNWTNQIYSLYGITVNKGFCLSGGSFKTVAQGGMSSYTPPTTITTAELAAIFGASTTSYSSSNTHSALHTMITFG
jgi:hypothetical protein